MKQDSKLRRSGAVIMANLILLLGSLAYIMLLAVINGSVGFLCAMGVTLCGAVGVAKALGESIALSYGTIIALAIGCAIGGVNGFFITYFKLPEFIVTLATRGILAGLALIIAVKDEQGFVKNVFIEDSLFLALGETVGPVYIVTIVFFLLAFLTQFFLKRTRAGTNCGSCRPIIARLNAEHDSALKEAAQ